jgi:hypothetical protein
VRRLPAVLLVMVVTGCGSKAASRTTTTGAQTETRTSAVVLQTPGGIGHWTKLLLSPNGRTYLAQWSGECEIPEAFFVPARGGKPRPVTGRRGDETIVLGWAPQNRARILIPRAACGRQFDKAGVYLVDPRGGKPVLRQGDEGAGRRSLRNRP